MFYGDKKQLASVCAIGSQDTNISIWRTDHPRPLVVLKNMFAHSILDMNWHKNGNVLLGKFIIIS